MKTALNRINRRLNITKEKLVNKKIQWWQKLSKIFKKFKNEHGSS